MAVPENLDETFARQARHATATWGAAYLENPTTFQWQPETFMYYDVTTGHEVWKMTNTPGLVNFYHNDTSMAVWSADGKRIALASVRPTQSYDATGHYIWMTADTNGAHFRPKVEGAGRLYNIYNPYFHWSQQVPNVFYEVGYGYGFSTSNLYQSTVSDSGVSRSLLATYPGAICLAKSVSPDGKKLIVFSYPQGTVYPTTVFPAFNIDVAAGYALDRDLGLYGNTPATVTQLHNQFVAGDGTWWFMEPEGSNAWWILQAVGSAADGGPFCDNSDFPVTDPDYDFGECIPGSTPGGCTQIHSGVKNGDIFAPTDGESMRCSPTERSTR